MDIKVFNQCRGCLCGGDSQYGGGEADAPLGEMSDNTIEMFTFCTNIQISKESSLPLKICQKCIENVHNCYEFINICKSTDEVFKNFLKQNAKIEYNIEFSPERIDEDCFSPDIKVEREDSDDGSGATHVTIKDEHVKRRKVKRDEELDNSKGERTVKEKTIELKCPVCEETLNKKSLYNQHMRVEHKEYKPYICDVCQKGYTRYSDLANHLPSHDKAQVFACDKCPKIYNNSGSLYNHKIKHKTELPYKCDHCPKSFPVKCYLIKHMKLHRGDKDHLCQLCGAAYSQGGALRIHMRSHTGFKPFSCTMCPYKATSACALTKHINTHTNTKKDKCPICDRAFNGSHLVARHLRVHTGERPYKCDHCSRTFTDNWNRKRHMVSAHSIAMDAIPKLQPKRKNVYAVVPFPDEKNHNI